MPQPATTCSACRHWSFSRQGNSKRAGHCRRHAPRPVETGGPVTDTQWPVTLEDDGCAEFVDASQRMAIEPDVEAAEPAQDKPVRTPRATSKGGKSRKTR
tara:strand:- start:855 stop:1154 length:300 start_codon:yes stop_codon:yes gene_type:complete